MKRRDVLTAAQRSYCMSRIRGRNTKPERTVQALVRSLRYKFLTHDSTLPGKPDVVVASRKKAVFVHGCFWHMHRCALGKVNPKSKAAFWRAKREANVRRDRRMRRRLVAAGWQALTIWQCQLRDPEAVRIRLRAFLRRKAPPKRRW